jgi:hypothetical protein
MTAHRRKSIFARRTCTCVQPKREPNYVRGFIQLMAIWVVVVGGLYFSVDYWPI